MILNLTHYKLNIYTHLHWCLICLLIQMLTLLYIFYCIFNNIPNSITSNYKCLSFLNCYLFYIRLTGYSFTFHIEISKSSSYSQSSLYSIIKHISSFGSDSSLFLFIWCFVIITKSLLILWAHQYSSSISYIGNVTNYNNYSKNYLIHCFIKPRKLHMLLNLHHLPHSF